MNKRPTSITVIAWIMLISAAFSLLASIFTINNPRVQEMMAKNPIPTPVQYLMLFGGVTISIVSAIFILRGANWARLLYIWWSGFGFVIAFLTSPAKPMLIPGVLLYLTVVFFLLRPKASAYFSQRNCVKTS
jgi:hypothetical protein